MGYTTVFVRYLISRFLIPSLHDDLHAWLSENLQLDNIPVSHCLYGYNLSGSAAEWPSDVNPLLEMIVHSSLTERFAALASGITSRVHRAQNSSKVTGRLWKLETQIRVRWAWISLPQGTSDPARNLPGCIRSYYHRSSACPAVSSSAVVGGRGKRIRRVQR